MTGDELCTYCERVLWGSPVYLGHGRYRHEECAPCSRSWCEYYDRLGADRKTVEGDMLYKHATQSTLTQ